MKFITVRCIRCEHNNKRLFDVSDDAKGVVKIKCDKCGNIVPIRLEEYLKNLHTEQRSII